MGFDKERNETIGENRGRGDRGRRDNNRIRPGRNRSGGGLGAGNSGRIENFEKPLIDLLKSINEKLDILIKK